MVQKTYDCAVIGLGGFGSATLYHLARQGVDVIGFEQFSAAHDRGSSHGETRIIRKACFEHPDYVPLLCRAYELFEELEQETGQKLFEKCGLFLAGGANGKILDGVRLVQEQQGVSVEEIAKTDWNRRFPGFCIPEQYETLYEPEAGFLYVEKCVLAHLELARQTGAKVRTESPVVAWHKAGSEFVVESQGEKIRAKKLVITAGAWSASLMEDLDVPLQVRRKVLCWHSVRSGAYNLCAGAPTFFFEMPEGEFYGFPSLDGQTVKLAEHSGGLDISHPDKLERDPLPGDGNAIEKFVSQCMPALVPTVQRQAVCMYTLTPDQHFLVDEHPGVPGLYLGAGFSGHGFKFTAVLGEILAQLVLGEQPACSIDFLRLARFRK